MKEHEVFPSEYFRASDLNGTSPVLTIERIETEEMRDGQKKRCLSFRESRKRLPLNVTNWRRTAEVIGERDDDRWVGRQIQLVKERVTLRGELVDAIRVASPSATPF
jgi:hypothetical protein